MDKQKKAQRRAEAKCRREGHTFSASISDGDARRYTCWRCGYSVTLRPGDKTNPKDRYPDEEKYFEAIEGVNA